MSKVIDETGRRFGRLVAVRIAWRNNGVFWECECDCGSRTVVKGNTLRSGITVSCGCYNRDVVRSQKTRLTHGGSGTRLYTIWCGIRRRCNNTSAPAYKNYGARGISVCEQWSEFSQFADWAHEGYSDDLTIDRIDVNGNYEPTNCQWIPKAAQSVNRRSTILDRTKVAEIRARLAGGERQIDLATEFGVSRHNIFRIAHGLIWKDTE
jgi:hypothetical protein